MGWEWAYCRHCDCGLGKPTAREVVEGVQHCANGHANTVTMTKDEFLIELAERVEELEARLDANGVRR